MNYELCLKLKESGFPQKGYPVYCPLCKKLVDESGCQCCGCDDLDEIKEYETKWKKAGKGIYVPSLEELIEACGDKFISLSAPNGNRTTWQAVGSDNNKRYGIGGDTSKIAVANLYLALNKKQ